MTNYLKLGAETLQSQMERFAGEEVLYRRVTSASPRFMFRVIAIPGRSPVDIIDKNGTVLRAVIQDFHVEIAAMRKKMEAPKTPLRGDEIVMTLAGRKIVFVVSGEDFSASHYEPADSYGIAWRIHTKADREE